MSQFSISNGSAGKSRVGLQRKKSKPKIQATPRPNPTNNGWSKPSANKPPWQRLKSGSKSHKATEKDSSECVDETGAQNETDLQLVTFDPEENTEKADDSIVASKSDDRTTPAPESDNTKENSDAQGKSKLPNGNTVKEFKREKSTLHLPRAPSSKKDSKPSGAVTTTDANSESQHGLLPRRDSTKLSLDATSRVSVDAAVQNTTLVVYPQEEKKKSVFSNNDSWIRSAIPCLPLCLAVICLIMNILVPGSGTVLSGLSILCCGKIRIATKDDQIMVTLCTNVWVGFAQLFTVTFLFVGWFWSLAWGLKMVTLAVEHRQQKKQERERQLQSMALRAFGSPLHVRPFSLVGH